MNNDVTFQQHLWCYWRYTRYKYYLPHFIHSDWIVALYFPNELSNVVVLANTLKSLQSIPFYQVYFPLSYKYHFCMCWCKYLETNSLQLIIEQTHPPLHWFLSSHAHFAQYFFEIIMNPFFRFNCFCFRKPALLQCFVLLSNACWSISIIFQVYQYNAPPCHKCH